FPEINCTIHGNAFYTPLLSSLGITVKGTTETAQYYNIVEIPSIPEGIEPLSDEENNAIFSELEKLKAKNQTLAVIMPYHGLIVGGKDADETFAIFEAIEKNSQFVIQREMLKGIIGQNSFSQENNLNQSRSFRSTGKNMISQTNDLDNKSKVLTSEDIVNYIKITDMKEIKVNSGCIITSQAESKAQELGIRIIKK
ncbi:MAG: class II aldolase/adducin family protein, partial [Actinomycetia bacterium]|nr:class II aldolase/adducin family protein [Actinomycetes bacterium]